MSEKNAAKIEAAPLLPLGRRAWAIQDGVLGALVQQARSLAANMEATRKLAIATPQAEAVTVDAPEQASVGSVAVLPIRGVITPRGSLMSMLFGGSAGGLEGFREDFAAAVANPEIGAVVLDVDSPGGLIDGVPETAAMIRDARGSKPIVAVADSCAASAAYWLACQADELIVTPAGEVGSIGVYMLHEDWSGANAKMGIVPTYVHVPQFKTEGNMDEPLSEEATKAWSQDVRDLYSMFVADVAAGRNVSAAEVEANYGKGRMLLAARAVDAGMADKVGTLSEALAGLLGASSSVSATTGAAARKRLGGRIEVTPAAASDGQPRCESCGQFLENDADSGLCPGCAEAKAGAEEQESSTGGGEPSGDENEQDEAGAETDDDDAATAASVAARAALLFS